MPDTVQCFPSLIYVHFHHSLCYSRGQPCFADDEIKACRVWVTSSGQHKKQAMEMEFKLPLGHFDRSGSEHKVSAAHRPPSASSPRATPGLGRLTGEEATPPAAHSFHWIPQGRLAPYFNTTQCSGPTPAP